MSDSHQSVIQISRVDASILELVTEGAAQQHHTASNGFIDDQLLAEYLKGKLSVEKAASAKLWTSEMLGRTADKCLQIFGGWGYMWEYPIAKAYAEARVERIAGGSSEVMKSIIIKSLFKELGIESEFN